MNFARKTVTRLTLALLAATLASPAAQALDKKQILEIAAKPHSTTNLLPGLKIFSTAREYKINLEVTFFQQKQVRKVSVPAKEKIVAGAYLVTEFTPPGAPAPMITVVTHHSGSGLYLKTTLDPGGNIMDIVGTSTPGSRAIAWRNVEVKPDQPSAFSIEQHTDTGSSWTELVIANGTPHLKTVGTAVKKPAADNSEK